VHTIEEIKSAVIPVASSYGVKSAALFGSYARGDATPESDVDIHIIDKGSLKGLFQLAGFQNDLEAKLGKSVDVMTSGSLSAEFLSRIKTYEVVLL